MPGPTYYGMIPAGATGPQSGHAVVNEPVTTYVVTATFLAAGLQISTYPNPVSDRLTIAPEGGVANDLQARLFTPLGQPVSAALELHPSAPAGLDVSGLAAGAYFFKVNGVGVSNTQKVVVTH